MSALEVRDASVWYRAAGSRKRRFAAVDGASFAVETGEMLGLVGESGCGKTTLGRAILGLVHLAGGEIRWDGSRIDKLPAAAFRPLRRDLQCVFQDPHACLDPRMTVAESIAEPLRNFESRLTRDRRRQLVLERLAETGLDAALASRYPHQLSGGQLQRAVIARALVLNPRFVVCDEPVSALDASVQGQIVTLLERIRDERRLASLVISHNLAVVARLCGRILVMFRGRIVEEGARAEIVRRPRHPYTRELLDAVPAIDAGARARLARRSAGVPRPVPDAGAAGVGCAYAPRCPHVQERCRAESPALQPLPGGGRVACHRAGEWPSGLLPAAPD